MRGLAHAHNCQPVKEALSLCVVCVEIIYITEYCIEYFVLPHSTHNVFTHMYDARTARMLFKIRDAN